MVLADRRLERRCGLNFGSTSECISAFLGVCCKIVISNSLNSCRSDAAKYLA